MQKFIPVLKGLLAACLGLLAIVVILNLAFGQFDGATRMGIPLLFGLYAFLFIGRANFVAATCPTCTAAQPIWRRPNSFRQLMWGGWTCANCGTEIDRHGDAIERKV